MGKEDLDLVYFQGASILFIVMVLYLYIVFYFIPKQLIKRLGSKKYASLYKWGFWTTIFAIVILFGGYYSLTEGWYETVERSLAFPSLRTLYPPHTELNPHFELVLVPPAGGLICVSIVRILELLRAGEP